MATTPTLQAVLLWQHHQTTTPNLPHKGPGGGARQAEGTLGRPIPAEEAPAPEKVEAQMAKPESEKEEPVGEPPFDTEENDEENEESGEEEEESGEEENGEEHQ